jgi:hypothetical protein
MASPGLPSVRSVSASCGTPGRTPDTLRKLRIKDHSESRRPDGGAVDLIEVLEAEATILKHRLESVLSRIRQLKRENRPKSRRLSANSREKIAAAQKKKWADYRVDETKKK